MSSGSKGPAVKKAAKVSAQTVLEDRNLRNTRAKANMMLHEQKKAAMAMDEFEEPGTALKLLTKEEKEFGAWESESDPHGMAAAAEESSQPDETQEGPVEEELDAPAEGEEAAEPNDEEQPKDEEQPNDEGEEAAEPPWGTHDETEDHSTEKQKGYKGGKGKWHNKPWWAQSKWKGKKGGGGRAGRKGQGKGVYDDWGGEYCYGGYRAVNGQFYPLLDFISLWLDVVVV